MWTTARIRRHIQRLDNAPFSSRLFLNYGSRSAVDQAIWRLVKRGEIMRVARGLFIKPGAPHPSSFEIARAKAEAFGRIILRRHGPDIVLELNLQQSKKQKFQELKSRSCEEQDSKALDQVANSLEHRSEKVVFSANGCTSSFLAGAVVIKLKGESPRKISLGNELVAEVIRGLWYLGKKDCTKVIAQGACRSFDRIDRHTLNCSFDKMPGWLTECFSRLHER